MIKSIALFIVVLVTVVAFTPFSRSLLPRSVLKAEQEIKDLDLDQMFEVFDAADKGKDISQVKLSEQKKDPGGLSDSMVSEKSFCQD
jgi:hypothetical protein